MSDCSHFTEAITSVLVFASVRGVVIALNLSCLHVCEFKFNTAMTYAVLSTALPNLPSFAQTLRVVILQGVAISYTASSLGAKEGMVENM